MGGETDAGVRSGERAIAIGSWLLVGGGLLLLVLSAVWWSSATGIIGSMVAWGVGSGGAIRGGAMRAIRCLKAENERLRAGGT